MYYVSFLRRFVFACLSTYVFQIAAAEPDFAWNQYFKFDGTSGHLSTNSSLKPLADKQIVFKIEVSGQDRNACKSNEGVTYPSLTRSRFSFTGVHGWFSVLFKSLEL